MHATRATLKFQVRLFLFLEKMLAYHDTGRPGYGSLETCTRITGMAPRKASIKETAVLVANNITNTKSNQDRRVTVSKTKYETRILELVQPQ